MASVYWDASRSGWRVQVQTHDGRRFMLWLGACTKTQATSIAAKIERLVIARRLGVSPEVELLQWIVTIDLRIRQKLIKADLIDDDRREIPRTLEAFVDWYIHHLEVKERTKKNLKAAKKHLVDAYGRDRQLGAITAGDAGRLEKKLYSQAKDSHAGKLLGRFRQFFAAAVKDRVIQTNPFAEVRVSTSVDKDRQAYVAPEIVEKLIQHAPNALWRTIIALARYGGLRVPSEIQALEWSHIHWAEDRFTIYSAKNARFDSGERICPIFPELRPHLDELFDQAPSGARYVCNRYRIGAGSPFRDAMISICAKAGVVPWPKLWHNLRASCRTDLERVHPAHVCDAWLGHSSAVAAKHYLRVTEQDFALALRRQQPESKDQPNETAET